MRTLAVLALAAAVAVAEILDYSFVGNLSNAESDFKFRFNDAIGGEVKIKSFEGSGMLWYSASVDAKTSDQGAKASANAIIGGATTIGGYPIAIAAYAKGKIDVNITDLKEDLIDVAADAGYSKGLVGLAILSVDEVGDNGNEIESHSMLGTNWGGMEDHSQMNEEGKVYVYTKDSNNFKLTFTTANVAGILNYANAPVAPASLEMILENKGLKLNDENNHFRVKVGLLTYGESKEYSGNALVGKSDDEQVYAAVSGKVNIDGKEVEAAVSLKEGKIEILNYDLSTYLGLSYVRIANVDFPKGKSEFIYDPSVGAGRVVYDGSATTAVLSLVALLLSAVAALF